VGARIEFKAPKRTLDQNSLLWAALTDVAQQVDHMGQRYSPDEWKILFMHACGREVRFLPGLDGKTFVPWGQSSSDLSKQEMTDLIEFIFSWGAEHGVTFNDPNPQSSEAAPHSATDEGSGEASPSPSPAADPSASQGDEEAGGIEAADDQSAPSASGSAGDDREWLLTVAKQLWAATGIGEQDLVAGVAADLRNSAPEAISQAARAKALSIVKQCKLVCFGEQDAADTLEIIAGIAGVETKDIV
jgi:hypothetical protein